eukprot:12643471-Heterocapsa_arctica.AAC.2
MRWWRRHQTPRQTSPAHYELPTPCRPRAEIAIVSPIPTRRFPTAKSSSCRPCTHGSSPPRPRRHSFSVSTG